MELIRDDTDRKLGLHHHRCRICGAEGMFESYLVREMLDGTRDEFEYFVCPECDCIQIAVVPDNLGDYYKNSYYSFEFKPERECEFESEVDNNAKTLDMGCGNGNWLYEMAEQGCGNLYGCDPFIDKDLDYGDRVHIRKCDISEMDGDGTFDVIRMGDSLEHVLDPIKVMMEANRLLKAEGILWINIPVFPNFIFDLFGAHWYALDAPRHIFVPSVKCLEYMAKKAGMTIRNVSFDCIDGHLINSFFYQHGISRKQIDKELVSKYFSRDDLLHIYENCHKANENQYGDHMTVYLSKVMKA
ncbi:class I SAM-dependent methyltransferase [Butyrivibrio sp. YAB3001]|uniref:class I SAM-dependent methyltransferase n=1 Tax=Butyrivibrio sp. YAB3001 TaxID=1520812 RepID=UPI0008F62843|nr:class I SAM-dependent methyltransferase [Butyrivibrio sp. YAB3001]SFB95170.1 Methyltransferase domain-containing protein [Butyrivibrio sp. YAB3001]